MNKFYLLALVALALAGCEVRQVEVVRGDGSWAKYTRTTLLGDSTTEGVSASKDGDDFTFDVGSTGSVSRTELLEAIVQKIPSP